MMGIENKLVKKITTTTLKTNPRKRTRRTTASVCSKGSKRKNSKNMSIASKESARLKGSIKRVVRKREAKNERKHKQIAKAPKSGKSTPVRLQKVDEFSISQEEEKESEISKSERERLEREILNSKSALSHNSDINMSNAPITRSKTKEYIKRKYQEAHGELFIPKINLGQTKGNTKDEQANSPGRSESGFNSPMRERLYTPIRAIARGITDSVRKFPFLSKNKKSHINYEVLNFAFCLGIVFVSLAIWMSSLLGKIPSDNYMFK